MKILILSNLYPPDVIGGYELGCKQVVDALQKRGHDVLVVTTAPRTPAPHVSHVARVLQLSEVWNDYLFHHSRAVTAHLLQAESALVNAFNVHALTRSIEAFEPDVAYVWNLVGVGGLGLMATLQHLGVPWLWHLMDDVPLTLCKLGGEHVAPLIVEVARQLDGRYLACSRQLVDEIEARGIPLCPHVEILPNWVVGQAAGGRSGTYRPGETLKVMSAGQINRNKGVDLLIEATARVVDRGHDNIQVDIYGNVEDPYFPSLVRLRGLDKLVRFRGSKPQAELVRLYPTYDVFAFPTWEREPFAFAPLEAARNGCVPLMSQINGGAEWFVHGVDVLKAERSSEAFADTFCAILDGAVDLGPLSRRAASVVERDFHLDALVPRIEAALRRAVRPPTTRPGSSSEIYRLALLAEKLSRVLIQEALPAA